MVIRRQPGDFVVRETLTLEASKTIVELPGPRTRFALYRVEKESLTTQEAASRVAKEIGAKPGSVSWAGLKDKHARTTQHMTVPVAGGPMSMARRVVTAGIQAELIGWCEREADASWIRFNEFTLVLRGLTRERAGAVVATVGARSQSKDGARVIAFMNYFGAQRFGSARHGEGFAARAIVAGEFERALRLTIGTPARKETGSRRRASRMLAEGWGRWGELASELPAGPERRAVEVLAKGGGFREAFASLPHFTQQMCVEAFQSWLWNRIAAELAGVSEWHGFVPYQPRTVSPDLQEATVPMPGPDAEFSGGVGPIADRVLGEEGVTLAGLRVPGLRRPVFGTPSRAAAVRAEAACVGAPERDELGGASAHRLSISFTLPRGAYATVFLAALEQWAESGGATRPA